MKKTMLLILFAGFMCLTSNLEAFGKSPKKFGDIDIKNLEMTLYKRDSSAAAVYIFDWGNAYLNYANMKLTVEMHVRIKIINSSGFSYGNVTIPHNVKSGIMKLKAATYNLDGGNIVTSEVDKSMIFDEKVTETYRKLKISFPDVREGSIIEYSYKIDIDDLFNLVPWYFQTSVPVMYSEFNIRIPSYFRYKVLYGGYESLSETSNKPVTERGGISSQQYHWVMRNIPAIKEEPYMPDKSNYISRIEFELESINIPGEIDKSFLSTWPQFEKGLIESDVFYKIPDKCSFLKDSLRAVTEGKEGFEKIKAIRSFVVRNVKWNKKERRMASDTPKKIFKEGEGNSADINLMLIGLMR